MIHEYEIDIHRSCLTKCANNTNEHCLTQSIMLKTIKLTRTTCMKGDTVICEAVAILVNFYTAFIYAGEHVNVRE